MSTGIEILGINEVSAEMRKRLLTLPRRSGVRAISAGAKVIKDKARALAPMRGKISRATRTSRAMARAGHYLGSSKIKKLTARTYIRKPGTLRRSIGYKFIKGDSSTIAVKILVRDPVGHLIEFGHKTKLGRRWRKLKLTGRVRTNKTRGSIAFVAARPFMRPAVDDGTSAAVDRIFEVILKELRK